jgi:Ca-activated chloride channel family protein
MNRMRASKVTWYAISVLLGGLLIFLGMQQQRYDELLAEGNLAVAEKQFDSQAYEQAAQVWGASHDVILFNQGVRAFRAGNFAQALQLFQTVSHATTDRILHSKTLYNASVIMLKMQQPEQAATLLKAALRLDPTDKDAKFNLEQLYRLVLTQDGEASGASLDQLPSPLKKEQRDSSTGGKGSGKGTEKPGI